MQGRRHLPIWLCLAGLGLACLTVGCSQAMPDRAARIPRGYLYYLDGAGGGSLLSNWSGGIKQGMLDAGYNGAGEMFRWNTGWGVVADQDSSVEYKRSKAAELASRIVEYRRQQPGAPVTLMGLSAGTSVVVFTLEALPADCPADNVVLLGASISSTYDLTQALRRVRNRMYVFTSEKDGVLAFLVPAAGTADRQQGVDAAGLRGFRMPYRASADTVAQYAKVSYIGWRPEFEQAGNFGGHTDTVKAPFVQEYIAPLVMRAGARTTAIAAAGPGKVRNPDYERWAGFPVGTWATFEGHQTFGGERKSVRMVAKLVARHTDKVVIERTYRLLDAGPNAPLRVQTFVAAADIQPQEHPFTSPGAKIVSLPAARLAVAGHSLACDVRTIEARGQFPEWGRDVACRMYACRTVPGGVVKVSLKSHKGSEPFEFDGQLVEYGSPGSSGQAGNGRVNAGKDAKEAVELRGFEDPGYKGRGVGQHNLDLVLVGLGSQRDQCTQGAGVDKPDRGKVYDNSSGGDIEQLNNRLDPGVVHVGHLLIPNEHHMSAGSILDGKLHGHLPLLAGLATHETIIVHQNDACNSRARSRALPLSLDDFRYPAEPKPYAIPVLRLRRILAL